jgi:hypothetical protein
MCCIVLLLALIGPRVLLFFMWVFGTSVDNAFDSWIWPLLGFFFLPWTTIMFALTWSPVVGHTGGDWVLIALGVVADIVSWSARSARNRYASSSGY